MDIVTDIMAKGHWMEIYQAIIGVLLTLLGIAIGVALSHTSVGKTVSKNQCIIASHATKIDTLFHVADANRENINKTLSLHTEVLGVVRELINQNTILIHRKADKA